jgi:bidirectional [NiFe] hydrogenase diaphorase subunit
VRTDTPAVRRLQKTGLRLLLSVHDVDCKNCPANKNCVLQDLAKFLKVGLKPKNLEHHLKQPDVDDTHPHLIHYPNRCVLCGKCIQVCRSANGSAMLAFARRGFDTVISFYGDPGSESPSCDTCSACVDICPVAALRPKKT